MTHRVYVVWSGHRKGQHTRRKLPGLRRGEWVYGNGTELPRELALSVAASMRARGYKARVVDLAGTEVVIRPRLHPLRLVIEARMAKVSTPKRKASRGAQGLLFGGAA